MVDAVPEFLYRLVPTRPAMLTDGLTAAERDAVAAHVKYLERLAADGVVLLMRAELFPFRVAGVSPHLAARA